MSLTAAWAVLPAASVRASDRDAAVAPATASAFNGRWHIDREHSDDYAAAVSRLIVAQQKLMERRRRERQPRMLPPDAIPPLEGENLPGEPPARMKARYDELLTPAADYRLAVDGNGLDLSSGGEPPRRYAPEDDGQRMDAFGTAEWSSAWEGQIFVIRARYTNGAVCEQRLSLSPDSQSMLVTLNFSDTNRGKLTVKTRYLRN